MHIIMLTYGCATKTIMMTTLVFNLLNTSLPSCVSQAVVSMSILQLAFPAYFWQLGEHQFPWQPTDRQETKNGTI